MSVSKGKMAAAGDGDLVMTKRAAGSCDDDDDDDRQQKAYVNYTRVRWLYKYSIYIIVELGKSSARGAAKKLLKSFQKRHL